ncbi:type II toxin-antitoxin system RelE/ParE family toxin [Candidatus Poribacteria bacterium]|nr:type II toxin-antitoxin system RelE/ParE family toxin [Candidatus Poribacteria bacterium]
MNIIFRTRALEDAYQHIEVGAKKWGGVVARRYVQRVDILKVVNDLSALRAYPSLRYHPLKGDREGQHSIKLANRYRLIFTFHGERMETVRIEEVSKHYGD